MTDRTHPRIPTGPNGAFFQASFVVGVAGLAALVGLAFLASVLSALPRYGNADDGPSPWAMALPSVPARAINDAGASLPDASAVFAGREVLVEESAPTF